MAHSKLTKLRQYIDTGYTHALDTGYTCMNENIFMSIYSVSAGVSDEQWGTPWPGTVREKNLYFICFSALLQKQIF